MTKFALIVVVLMISTGCASLVTSKAELVPPQTGFAGLWETEGPVDTGPTFGIAKVRLEIDPNCGEWRVFWTRPDGSSRAGMGGQTWAASQDTTTAKLLQRGPGTGLRVELIDARTARAALFENPIDLHRIDRRG
jgi:hypothetical protein